MEHVMEYQKEGSKVECALISVTAGGQGITLTKAEYNRSIGCVDDRKVFFAELHWTPGLLIQAEDRAHRIGKKGDVEIYYLLGKQTLDEKIW